MSLLSLLSSSRLRLRILAFKSLDSRERLPNMRKNTRTAMKIHANIFVDSDGVDGSGSIDPVFVKPPPWVNVLFGSVETHYNCCLQYRWPEC